MQKLTFCVYNVIQIELLPKKSEKQKHVFLESLFLFSYAMINIIRKFLFSAFRMKHQISQ